VLLDPHKHSRAQRVVGNVVLSGMTEKTITTNHNTADGDRNRRDVEDAAGSVAHEDAPERSLRKNARRKDSTKVHPMPRAPAAAATTHGTHHDVRDPVSSKYKMPTHARYTHSRLLQDFGVRVEPVYETATS
jgi:hypothetical protein